MSTKSFSIPQHRCPMWTPNTDFDELNKDRFIYTDQDGTWPTLKSLDALSIGPNYVAGAASATTVVAATTSADVTATTLATTENVVATAVAEDDECIDNCHYIDAYKVISDENEVLKFFKLFFKDALEGYSVMLLPVARRKYWTPLSTSTINLSKQIISMNIPSERFVAYLRKYEVLDGLHKDKTTSIPSEALAYYLTSNPLSEKRAFCLLQKEMIDRMQQMLLSPTQSFDLRADKMYDSCLHRSADKTFMKLDVDTKVVEQISVLKEFFRVNEIKPFIVVESRGGYHILLKRSELGELHKAIHSFVEKNNTWISVEKDGLIIIPGTYQGGFPTRIVDWLFLQIK
jgi:hypothetical protein